MPRFARNDGGGARNDGGEQSFDTVAPQVGELARQIQAFKDSRATLMTERVGTGLVVPVKDAPALAGAIERLHLNRAWARQLGLAARARALREFDEKIVISKTLAVYGELLNFRN